MLKSSVGLFCFIWTSNFSICLWGRPNTAHFHDFEIYGRVHDSQNQLFLQLETPRYLNPFKKNPKSLKRICGNLRLSEIEHFNCCGKDSRRSIPTNRRMFFENLEYEIKIFQKTWNGMLVIWDQYLSQTWNRFFWIFETLNLWNEETEKLRNFFIFH